MTAKLTLLTAFLTFVAIDEAGRPVAAGTFFLSKHFVASRTCLGTAQRSRLIFRII